MKRTTSATLTLGLALNLGSVLFRTRGDVTPFLLVYLLALLLPYGLLLLVRARLNGDRAADITLLVSAILLVAGGAANAFMLLATQDSGQASAWAALFALVIAAVEVLIAAVGSLTAWLLTRRQKSRA